MIGDVKMQTVKRRTGRSLTGDRPLFLALHVSPLQLIFHLSTSFRLWDIRRRPFDDSKRNHNLSSFDRSHEIWFR